MLAETADVTEWEKLLQLLCSSWLIMEGNEGFCCFYHHIGEKVWLRNSCCCCCFSRENDQVLGFIGSRRLMLDNRLYLFIKAKNKSLCCFATDKGRTEFVSSSSSRIVFSSVFERQYASVLCSIRARVLL